MECKEKKIGHTVIPVFCYVDPSHVRYQSESFAEAFAKHESRYKDDVEGMQKVQGWRNALAAAANLKGYDIRDWIESDFIQHIVSQVSFKLCKTSVSYLRNVVGIDTHLEKVKSLLEMEINDVRIVGIWGMGGVGKTTIARAIFDTNSNRFDGACFLADIKENKCGMHSLQNILLSKLLRIQGNHVNNKEDGKHMIAHRLRSKKVLVVLDDIDHNDHLDNLAGDLDWFGKGSRIIATTRDRHLLGKNDVVYKVTALLNHDAIKLFHQYAFKEEVPGECFEKLSLEVIHHAKGLPLALKVWGSFLHKRDIIEWRSAIEQMKIKSKSEIVEKLKISYDRLETIQQDIFLDIACFLRGDKKEDIMEILESCYSGANIELSVLIDKSLVFIDNYDRIQMHDLIQDMCKYIVNMQKDPGERSRLWEVKDLKEVLVNNTGTVAVEVIWNIYIPKLWLSKEAMKNMKRLRILHITDCHGWLQRDPYPDYCPGSDSEDNVSYDSNCHDGFIEYLPNNLRWFTWYRYPCKSLPENFKPQRLVHLELQDSLLHELWTKRKILLPSLRRLDLRYSRSLMATPDFTGMPNLEYLDLSGCKSLKEVHHSLGCSRKLISLELYGCINLERFPCVNVESLEKLYLMSCCSLEKFPEFLGRLKLKLDISERGGSEISSDLPTELDLSNFKNLVAFPSSIGMLKSLVKLYLSYCSKFESLSEGIGDLENLEELRADYTLISQPPSSIIRLNKLKSLSFAKKKTGGGLVDGVFFVFPHVNEGLHSLEKLDLRYCNLTDGGLPEDIGCLSSLKELHLQGNNFEHLPLSIAQLGSLRSLDLSECRRLKKFLGVNVAEGLRSLENLNLSYCNLKEGVLPEDIGCLSSLKELNLQGNNFEYLPRSIAQLGSLRSLDLSECKRLKEFLGVNVAEGLRSLENLNLSYCNIIDGGLPEDIGGLSSLKELNLQGNNFEHLPRSIAQLGALQTLHLSDCHMALKIIPNLPQRVIFTPLPYGSEKYNDLIPITFARAMFQNISDSHSLSLRMFTIEHAGNKIPSWFHHRGTDKSVSVNLPENWYTCDNFLGFVVCYYDRLVETTAHLIPLCNRMPWMIQKLSESNHSECYTS
ncbi:TMV resistance protein N-like, partial [Solanum stenotomum]|uniref:TMV resistance protein N-like n=1 Tax=Solanum stenotomum TaxID=172797 RepID=UPI0020D1BDB5